MIAYPKKLKANEVKQIAPEAHLHWCTTTTNRDLWVLYRTVTWIWPNRPSLPNQNQQPPMQFPHAQTLLCLYSLQGRRWVKTLN